MLTHLIQHGLELHEPAPLKVRLHVVHDAGHILAALRLLVRQFLEQVPLSLLGRRGRNTERVAHLVAQPAGDTVLKPRGRFQALDEGAAFEIGQHAIELIGNLLKFGQQVLLFGDGFVHFLPRGARVVSLAATTRKHRGRQPES